MHAPPTPPSEKNLDAWREFAMAYVGSQFGAAAPSKLGEHQLFDISPLDGDGATVIFRFDADRSGHSESPYFAVVGQTEPNYYDATGLDLDEAFSLHLGTRFMLVLGVGQVKDEPDARDDDGRQYNIEKDARMIVDRVAPQASLADVSLAALFDVNGERHAVIRARVADQEVYIMGRDAPFGFSHRTDLPAPMAYRLHIGAVLRAEPKPEIE